MIESLWLPFVVVAIAEIGDKTQLLAIVLAAKFRKPLPIIAGILAATLANHALAAWAGHAAAIWLSGAWFKYAVAAGFFAMAAWALIPDKPDDGPAFGARGVFVTTLIAFFLVEMGDKTQIATALMGARYDNPWLVTVGTTLGMMAANVPAIYAAEAAMKIVSPVWARRIASVLFALSGAAFLLAK